MVLRILGCLFAVFIAFVVCMLIASEIAGPSPAVGVQGNLAILLSLGVAGAFGWAFWKWPARKDPS